MPKIVQYFAKERAAVGDGVRATDKAFGAGIGRAVQDLGAAVGGVAGYVRQKEKIREAEESTVIINELEDFVSTQSERASSPDADIYNFKDTELELLSGRVSELTEGRTFSDPNIRLRLNDSIDRIQRNVSKGAFSLESSAIKDRRDVAVEQSINSTLQGVLKGTKDFDTAIDDVSMTMEGFRNSYNPVEFESTKRANISSMAATAVNTIAATNTDLARELLQSEKAAEVILPDQLVQLNKTVDNIEKKKIDTAIKLKDKHPYQYLASIGKPAPDLDFESPDNFSASVEVRNAYRDKITTEDGIELPFLSENEVNAIEEQLDQSDSQTRLAIMATMDSGLGDEEFVEVGQSLFNGKRPEFGVALSVSSEDASTANDILNGADRIRNKTLIMPSNADLLKSFNEELSQTVFDPEVNASFYEAVKSHYAESIFRTGNQTQNVDDGVLNNSINKVLGGVIEVGGFFSQESKILSFRDKEGVPLEGDKVDDIYESITNVQLKDFGLPIPHTVTGQEIDMGVIYSNSRLTTVGDGLYLPIMADGTVPVDADGNSFILNLKEIHRRRTK